LAAWLLLPAVIFAGLIARELATTSAGYTPTVYIEAFGFFVAFGYIPWLVLSGLGFALGLGLRRPGRRARDPDAARPIEHAQEQSPLPFTLLRKLPPWSRVEADGWVARHVGFEGDGLIIDGVDIWSCKWRPLAAPRLQLPHPGHAAQRHDYQLFDAVFGSITLRFAAAELSNGVWGFYTRIADEVVSAGVTADGALRYETKYADFVGQRPSVLTTVAYLYNGSTGAVVASGVGWMSSRIKADPGGTLLLSLRHFNHDALFRVNPAAGTFETVGAGFDSESLDGLDAAVKQAQARILARRQEPLGLRMAPDGSIRVELVAVEWSNSHWVNAPRVLEAASGRVLLDLWNTDWDAEVTFPCPRMVALQLRRYAAPTRVYFAELDLATDQFLLLEISVPPARGRTENLRPALERASRRAVQRPAGGERPLVRVGQKQKFMAAWILAGAILAIAALTSADLALSPAQKLLPLALPPDFPAARQAVHP
jgi:hypothetical protein